MDRKKLLIRIVILIFVIFLVNYFAEKFYWYSAIWYFDMIMHFLGGFWVGLAAIWFLSQSKNIFTVSFVFQTLLFVFLIGIFWELFEIVFYNYITQSPLNLFDISSDIFFDLSGGTFAILYCSKGIMFKIKNTAHPIVEL